MIAYFLCNCDLSCTNELNVCFIGFCADLKLRFNYSYCFLFQSHIFVCFMEFLNVAIWWRIWNCPFAWNSNFELNFLRYFKLCGKTNKYYAIRMFSSFKLLLFFPLNQRKNFLERNFWIANDWWIFPFPTLPILIMPIMGIKRKSH